MKHVDGSKKDSFRQKGVWGKKKKVWQTSKKKEMTLWVWEEQTKTGKTDWEERGKNSVENVKVIS